MRPVGRTSARRVATLIAAGLVVGSLIRPVALRADSSPPRIGWGAAGTLVVLAVVVGMIAWATWQSLHRRHERMTSAHGIKMLALAKASAIVAAGFAGGYAGYALAFAGDLDTTFGQERFTRAGTAAVAAVVLLVAGLLLERACELPEENDEDDTPSGGAGSAA